MHFRIEATAERFTIIRPIISLTDLDAYGTQVHLRPPSNEERALVEPPDRRNDAVVWATTQRPVGDALADVFSSQVKDNTSISAIPEPARELAEAVYRDLIGVLVQAVNLLRWRSGTRGPHHPLTNVSYCWSLDNAAWHPISRSWRFRRIGQVPFAFTDQIIAEINTMLTRGHRQPIGHDLWREAWALHYDNPRSAVILCIAAVEVGLKECLSKLAPDASWLVENLPAPPVDKMIRSYLPQLLEQILGDRQYEPPAKSVTAVIKRGIEIRNSLVHKPPTHPEYKKALKQLEFCTLERLLWSAYNLLWMFDYYKGYEWAAMRVDKEVREQWLGWQMTADAPA